MSSIRLGDIAYLAMSNLFLDPRPSSQEAINRCIEAYKGGSGLWVFDLHPMRQATATTKSEEPPQDNAVAAACLQTNKGIQRGICRYASLTRRLRMSAYDTKRTCRRFVVSEDSLTRHSRDTEAQLIWLGK
jgi:hypothetical protein